MQMYVFIDRKYAKLCTFEIVSMQNIDSTQLKIDERCQHLPGKNYPTTSINPVVVLKLSDNPPTTLPSPPPTKKKSIS